MDSWKSKPSLLYLDEIIFPKYIIHFDDSKIIYLLGFISFVIVILIL